MMLTQFFQEQNGKLSMNRLLSFALVCSGVVGFFLDYGEVGYLTLIGYGVGSKYLQKRKEVK